jgi:uncharacterized protein YndB with AHSA1/START domain
MPTKNKSSDIKIIRIFDAPVKAVWDAWTDPKQVAQWWGPRGFTLTTRSKDVKTGGTWDYTMHGPDGTDYPNLAKYLEVEQYKKLVYDHGATHDKPALFRVTVLFTEAKGKTKMDMTMSLPTPEAAEETRKFIKQAGGDSTWDRLGEYLDKESTGKDRFIINRSFDAPLDLMFKMWTDPKHFAQWLPPTGATMEFIHCDIRTGGESFYVMPTSSGVKMYGKVNYLKIEKPDTLVYTQQFCDENENLSRHPFAPTWPATMLTMVKLTEEGPNRTRVTITWEPYGEATAEEVETFVKAKAGMTQGWTGSFDKLDAYLENNQQLEKKSA